MVPGIATIKGRNEGKHVGGHFSTLTTSSIIEAEDIYQRNVGVTHTHRAQADCSNC